MPEFEGLSRDFTPRSEEKEFAKFWATPQDNSATPNHYPVCDDGCTFVAQLSITEHLCQELACLAVSYHHDDDLMMVGILETLRDIQYRFSTSTTSALNFYKERLKSKSGAAQ